MNSYRTLVDQGYCQLLKWDVMGPKQHFRKMASLKKGLDYLRSQETRILESATVGCQEA